MTEDLNDLAIDMDRRGGLLIKDSRVTTDESAEIHAYFFGLREKLLEHIGEANTVVGAVAWLTDPVLLESLAKVPNGSSVIVQKEDFLRPDGSMRRDRLRELYGRITPAFGGRRRMGLSVCLEDTRDSVRCVGNYNGNHSITRPRAHHKFAVFCDRDGHPYAVWTGSYNWTLNAAKSLENAVFIRSDKIASRFMLEWWKLFALSEPLDWTCDWVAPEYRIGT